MSKQLTSKTEKTKARIIFVDIFIAHILAFWDLLKIYVPFYTFKS